MSENIAVEAAEQLIDGSDKNQQIQQIHHLMANSDVQKLYANGFGVGMSNADTFIVFQLGGHPTVIVNLSFTLAKTLSKKLGDLIQEFESKAGQTILTTDQVAGFFDQS